MMNTEERIIGKFLESHLEEALQIIEGLETEDIVSLIERLPMDQSQIIVTGMVPFRAGRVIERMDSGLAVKLIEYLPPKVSEAMLRQVSSQTCDQILQGLPAERARHFKRTLRYAKDLAGAYLEPVILTFTDNLRVGEGLEELKKNATGIRSRVFILARDRKLVGFIELRDLLTFDPGTPVRSVMNTMSKAVSADMHVNDLLESWDNDYADLPVVNSEGIFLGIISRISLDSGKPEKTSSDRSAIKAGNALGELYLIGLTSLFGSATDVSDNPSAK